MSELALDQLYDRMRKSAEFENAYATAKNAYDRRLIVRKFYEERLPEIMQLAEQNAWVSAYPVDWRFNDNELSLWGSIRARPIVMYPEFPVLGYFVDFGNPFLKIAIEADSEKWHDKEKDRERNSKLLEIGWKTFRVSYKENFAPFKELGEIAEMISGGNEDEAFQEMENWMLNTSDGVVDAIEFFYFMSANHKSRLIEKFPDYLDLAERTLKRHRLVNFALPGLF